MSLPLRVTAFERYLLADDRVSHSMSFTIRLKFAGRLDPAALRTALNRALKLHPLLDARLVGQGGHDLRWAPGDGTYYLDVADAAVPMRFPDGERIDPRRQGGLRVWARHGADRVELRFQFHHACSDGIAAYRVIEDVLVAYDQAVHGAASRAEFRPLDAARLRQRNRFGLSWWKLLLRLPIEIWGVVVGLTMFFCKRPVAIVAPEPLPADVDPLPLLDYPAHTFDEVETRKLLAAAKAQRATVNDLLLRDLLLGMFDWNTRHDPRTRGRMLRAMIPINLRDPADEALPAANVVGMVFIDRRPSWHRNLRSLLWGIRWETQFLKSFRFAISFARNCSIFGIFPGGLEFLARAHRCYCTFVFSNMGRLFTEACLQRSGGQLQAGGLTLEAIESAPPVRPFSSAGLTSLSYDGRLVLVMNYDRYRLAPATAEALLATLVARIRQSF